jgi:hypothetical protein
LTDPLAFETLVQLVRRGYLDLDDCEEIAARLADDGEDKAAHSARMAFVEAHGEQPKSEAELRREQMVLVPRVMLGPVADGGNSAP